MVFQSSAFLYLMILKVVIVILLVDINNRILGLFLRDSRSRKS